MKQKLLNTLQGWSLRILTAGLIIFTGYNPVMADEAVLDAADYSADYTFGSKTVSDITFTATNNGSGNGIKYFASSKSFRIYGGASLNITANSKYVITKVVIARGDNSTSNQTWVSGVSSTPVGFNIDNDTWTGSSQTVSIKNGGSSGNTRFTKVTVTYSAVDTSLGDIMYGDALANGGLTADAEHGDVFTFTAENAESMSINVGADTEAVATGTNSVSWTAPKVTSENTAYNLKITATKGTETKEASYTVYVSPAPACGVVVFDPASGEIIKGSFVNITCENAKQIKYWFGDDATAATTVYVADASIQINETCTLNAVGVNADGLESDVASAMYTVKLPDYVELIFNCSQSTGTQISKANSTNVSYMIETNSQDMVTSLSDAANLCGGAANSDVKAVRFGSYANKSYNQGALTITLKESYKIKSIDVTLSTYKSTNSSAPANPTWNLDINGYQMAETISTDVENPTVYNISFGNTDAKEASVNTLTIKSTNAPVDVYSLRINIDPVPTEIVEIVTEQSGEAVYYNLQGVRVDNPANGIFIRVANGKSSKVIL